MSDDKTEEPTEQKLRDSREKGQIPERKNILEFIILFFGVAYIATTWKTFVTSMGRLFDASFSGVANGPDVVKMELRDAFTGVMSYSLIFMTVLALLVLLLNLILTKFNFSVQAMSPKFEKFNPVNGLKGIFSRKTLYNFGRVLTYFLSASITLVAVIYGNFEDILDAGSCGLRCLAIVFPSLFMQTTFTILSILFVLAAIDFKVQTALFMKQVKMSKDEVKRENKGSQGDPLIKGARKQIAHEDMHLPTLKEVTHVVYSNSVLVAMIYSPGNAPYVVMKSNASGVPRALQKLRSSGKACVNLPNVASEFYRWGRIGQYLDKRAAKGMTLILEQMDDAS